MRALAILLCLAGAANAGELEGTWRGTLGGQLRIVLTLSKAADGGYTGILDSVADGINGLGAEGIPYLIDAFDVTGDGGEREKGAWELPTKDLLVGFPRPR